MAEILFINKNVHSFSNQLYISKEHNEQVVSGFYNLKKLFWFCHWVCSEMLAYTQKQKKLCSITFLHEYKQFDLITDVRYIFVIKIYFNKNITNLPSGLLLNLFLKSSTTSKSTLKK